MVAQLWLTVIAAGRGCQGSGALHWGWGGKEVGPEGRGAWCFWWTGELQAFPGREGLCHCVQGARGRKLFLGELGAAPLSAPAIRSKAALETRTGSRSARKKRLQNSSWIRNQHCQVLEKVEVLKMMIF